MPSNITELGHALGMGNVYLAAPALNLVSHDVHPRHPYDGDVVSTAFSGTGSASGR